ncbi:hypothetical protein D9753_25070 [Streptomyces dangxiongensis]|uniref:B12-binding domain-containing protein n=2 Tax=Streptomyces dangxiongensis TaxID=1442032 RepID=A0A3G2JGR2_9ACTN|nr:hypothetical protein D9753_25070 [Streptomyces dangxiongensis]
MATAVGEGCPLRACMVRDVTHAAASAPPGAALPAQQTVSAETMPQAIAGLATYATTKMDLRHPVWLFKYPEALAAALEQDGPPDVIGFSHYIWNSQLSLAFAELVKRRFPHTTVVFGGPHYPLHLPDQTDFWHQRLAGKVDFYVEGEGEPAFADLLLTFNDFDRKEVRGTISGAHNLHDDGILYTRPPRLRIHNLSSVPSPYLAGLMDEFFDGMHPRLTAARAEWAARTDTTTNAEAA